jgi:hypothetical protein
MANLSGQNIGTNYKGILNLNTLNGNLTTTLQAVTDGDGNTSPLRLSTTRVDVGTFVFLGGITNAFPAIKRNAAVLEVRLADDSGLANLSCAALSASGSNNSFIQSNNALYGALFEFNGGRLYINSSGATIENRRLSLASLSITGASSDSSFAINHTWNTTGNPSAIFLNITNTASGASSNLMDLQVGGVSQFKVDKVGAVSIGNTVQTAVSVASTHKVTVVIGGVTYYLLATNV